MQLPAEVKVDFTELRLFVVSQLQAIAKDESAFKRMPLYMRDQLSFFILHIFFTSHVSLVLTFRISSDTDLRKIQILKEIKIHYQFIT